MSGVLSQVVEGTSLFRLYLCGGWMKSEEAGMKLPWCWLMGVETVVLTRRPLQHTSQPPTGTDSGWVEGPQKVEASVSSGPFLGYQVQGLWRPP